MNYWDNFYTKFNINYPSDRALSIDKNFDSIIDFGCGNGRDSHYFASLGKEVISCDVCEIALSSDLLNHTNITKYLVDFSINPYLFVHTKDVGYSRFLLHAVDSDTETKILQSIRNSVKKNGKVYIEVRSDKGIVPDSTHYRRLINKNNLVDKLECEFFHIVDIKEDINLAKTDSENPIIIRVECLNRGLIPDKPKIISNSYVIQLKEMLFNIIDLFEKYKIDYWLDFGTLLGAVREGKIIEWDEDIDICTWGDNKHKIRQLERDLLNLGYDVYNNDYGCKVWYSINNHNIWTDIYYWKKNGKIYEHVASCFAESIRKFNLDILGNFKKISLYERDFIIPENSIQKLELMYGDWEIPVKQRAYWGA